MSLKPLRIIAVGKLKTPYWQEAATHYLARLKHWRAVEISLLKDGDAALPIAERNELEGRRILAACTPQDTLIIMDERGKSFTSPQFSAFVSHVSENAASTPCFVLGGAFGLSPAVRQAARHVISLGSMTFPHELARVLLLEQLYRAEAICRNVPYHH
jgi:23S rRNA (pseudouridine1915-N3)-methyltransferase